MFGNCLSLLILERKLAILLREPACGWRCKPAFGILMAFEGEVPAMRLQKYLASSGIASRRKAEEMIADGRVSVNGEVITAMGTLVQPGDSVLVDGQPALPEEGKHYILYYKPIGEVTTVNDPQGRPCVLDRFRDYPARLYPVGRLDFDSEGLLILTNDGELTQCLTHPSHEVEKRYIARVSNNLEDEALFRLRAGVMLDGRKTAPAKVSVLRRDPFSTDILISIHEGRNRQIRRMVEAVGHQVVRLKRVQYGALSLGDMKCGEWRELSAQEVALLK